MLLGANDASLPVETNRFHVPLEQYKENLGKIINHPHIKAHQPKIILVTPPPVNELKLAEADTAQGHPCAIRTVPVSATYCETARQVARENPGVALVDLHKAILEKAISMAPGDYVEGGPVLGSPENGKAGGLTTLLPDGLHMNGDAYRVFYDALIPHIDEPPASEEPEVTKDYPFPIWFELNPPNLPRSHWWGAPQTE